MFSEELVAKTRTTLELARKNRFQIATAESCTGGLLAGLLTEIPGASDVFERGFVTYSNAAKWEELGVRPDIISSYGAVSAEVAEAMANGAIAFSHANLAVSITGIAGPNADGSGKPVGLVYIGWTRGKSGGHEQHQFSGNRQEIRLQSVEQALRLLAEKAAI
jgi:nicotinamide-nucleotide amidase